VLWQKINNNFPQKNGEQDMFPQYFSEVCTRLKNGVNVEFQEVEFVPKNQKPKISKPIAELAVFYLRYADSVILEKLPHWLTW